MEAKWNSLGRASFFASQQGDVTGRALEKKRRGARGDAQIRAFFSSEISNGKNFSWHFEWRILGLRPRNFQWEGFQWVFFYSDLRKIILKININYKIDWKFNSENWSYVLDNLISKLKISIVPFIFKSDHFRLLFNFPLKISQVPLIRPVRAKSAYALHSIRANTSTTTVLISEYVCRVAVVSLSLVAFFVSRLPEF